MLGYQGYIMWRSNRPVFWRLVGAAMGVAVACLATPVVRHTCVGLARFVLETGTTNTVAHGITWTGIVSVKLATEEALASPVLFEFLKFGWLFIVLIACARLAGDGLGDMARLWRPRNNLLWAVVISCVTMIPWTMGRIS